jgi:hypothetical protein
MGRISFICKRQTSKRIRLTTCTPSPRASKYVCVGSAELRSIWLQASARLGRSAQPSEAMPEPRHEVDDGSSCDSCVACRLVSLPPIKAAAGASAGAREASLSHSFSLFPRCSLPAAAACRPVQFCQTIFFSGGKSCHTNEAIHSTRIVS